MLNRVKKILQVKFTFTICLIVYFVHCGEATKELNQCKTNCDTKFTLCYLIISTPPTANSEGAVSGSDIILPKTNPRAGLEWMFCYLIRESCLSTCIKTSSSSSTTRTTSSRSSSSSSSSSGGGGSASGGGAGGS